MNTEEENPFLNRIAPPDNGVPQKEPLPKSDRAIVPFNPKTGFEFRDIDGMLRAANCYLQSGFAPSHIRKAQQLIVLWAQAAEMGVGPMTAINKMSVIGNKAGPMTELALALVEQRGLLEDTPRVEYSGEGDDSKCTVTVQRKGRKSSQSWSFSMKDAKTANLIKPGSAWITYPEDMLYARAMGRALHRVFPDVMAGMYTAEELSDFPQENNR